MSTNCAFHLCYLYIFQFLLERYIILEFFFHLILMLTFLVFYLLKIKIQAFF